MSRICPAGHNPKAHETHCNDCALNPICLPMAVSDADLHRLENIIERGRPLQRGDHVFRSGDRFDSIFAVRSGALKTYRLTPEGDEQIMGFHLPGEMFGLGGLAGHVQPNAAVALETSAVCEVPFERMEGLALEIPSLQHHLFHIMGRQISEDEQLLMLLSKRSAEERIAALLLSLSARFQRRNLSATRFRLPMSRGDIGNFLGLVVETVSRVFTRLQAQGVIDVQGKDVHIMQPAALSAISGTQVGT
ncbi:MAG: fumarate/nitrate reduction transcriptional regulator Fnr [Gammaproteobacteria bacterium]|nr:MAG: fumarate/nitrate reduction transcriptional regulator Fnr [Gammaproteobacteria bacterium]